MTVDERTFTLADSFERINRLQIDHSAPLPLGHGNAIRRGLQLREAGAPHLSYHSIAHIMCEYHGIRRSAGWWREHLKAAGASPRPRGVPMNGTVR